MRLQAGEVVGDDLRQHRDDAVRQVNTRGTLVGLAVERCLRLDEVRDVGDVHAEEPVAVIEALQRDRIVEIASVDGVDRYDRELGQVAAAPADRFVEQVGLLASFGEGVIVEFAGQVKFVDDRHGVDAGLSAGAEDIGDDAFTIADVRGKADHLDDDFVVRPNAFRAGIADVDRVAEDFAVDLDHAHAGLFEVDTDEAVGGPLDDIDDLAFVLAHAAALRIEADGYNVAAGGVAGFVGGD